MNDIIWAIIAGSLFALLMWAVLVIEQKTLENEELRLQLDGRKWEFDGVDWDETEEE